MRRTGDSSVTRSPSGRRKRGMTKDRLTSSGLVKTRVAIESHDPGLGRYALADLPAAERAEAERLDLGPHRLAEFRAGRLAAHAALDTLLGPAAAGLVIARADDGAPLVVGADVQISISHGRRFAVAVAGA